MKRKTSHVILLFHSELNQNSHQAFLFGKQYLGIAPLLWLYALATSLYALANVVINYRLSLGMGRDTRFALAAGVAQILGIILFHQTLAQVV